MRTVYTLFTLAADRSAFIVFGWPSGEKSDIAESRTQIAAEKSKIAKTINHASCVRQVLQKIEFHSGAILKELLKIVKH